MRDGLPASYDSWKLASPPWYDAPYYWDCPVCGTEGNGEDEKCTCCNHYEDDTTTYCADCDQLTWRDDTICYSCDEPHNDGEEKDGGEEEIA